MKKFFPFLAIIFFSACQSPTPFTAEERDFIYLAAADVPFRILQITERDDSVLLRTVSTDMKNYENDSLFMHFIRRLESTLQASGGVGIAASQVGIRRNVFLFTRLDLPNEPVAVAINPRILGTSENKINFENDGCLSIENIRGISKRFEWIDVEYFNPQGEKITERLTTGRNRQEQFTGVIFQHEYDHTKGVLFIDRLD